VPSRLRGPTPPRDTKYDIPFTLHEIHFAIISKFHQTISRIPLDFSPPFFSPKIKVPKNRTKNAHFRQFSVSFRSKVLKKRAKALILANHYVTTLTTYPKST